MPTRPTLTLADRAALTRGSPDANPFAREGNPDDNFDFVVFLRGDEFVRADERVTSATAPVRLEAAAATPAVETVALNSPVVPVPGVLAEGSTPPDLMIGTDGPVAFDSSSEATPALARASGLAGDLARSPATVDEAASVQATVLQAAVLQAAVNTPATTPIATLSGGPLIVQLDPTGSIATPIGTTPRPIVATVTTPPVTASTPGFTLEWAPVLEAYGAAASVHVSIFDTNGDTDSGLLAALHELPPLPPITPPNGEGLGD